MEAAQLDLFFHSYLELERELFSVKEQELGVLYASMALVFYAKPSFFHQIRLLMLQRFLQCMQPETLS